jgi:hypothetical protein
MNLKSFALLCAIIQSLIACLPSSQASETNSSLKPPTSYPLWFKELDHPTATWGQEEPQSNKLYFRNFLKKPKQSLPLFTNELILNCLDYVIYSALKFKLLTFNDAWQVYERKSRGEHLEKILFPSGSKQIFYKVEGKTVIFKNLESIVNLDIILMDGPSHVIQAIRSPEGSNDRLRFVSFSPRPIWGDGSSETNLENITPEVTTLESLIEEMIELYPDVPSDWNDIHIVAGRPFWIKN